jgi:hypothetical protein
MCFSVWATLAVPSAAFLSSSVIVLVQNVVEFEIGDAKGAAVLRERPIKARSHARGVWGVCGQAV